MVHSGILDLLHLSLDVKSARSDPDNWINFENNKDMFIPVHYAFYNLLYQDLYFKDVYDKHQDCSVVIYNGGRVSGIWPLSFWSVSGNLYIGSNGGELLPPLLCPDISIETQRRIYEKCTLFLSNAKNGGVNISIKPSSATVMEKGISQWVAKLMEKGAVCNYTDFDCFVDLSMNSNEILSKIRRTNKYSIKKAEGLWKSVIVSRESSIDEISKAFKLFRELHIEVAGRETRSIFTWKMQEKALKNSDDFLVLLYDEFNSLIGASLFSTTGSAVSYSVAAYKRELFKQPVGHLSLWLAIEHSKILGKKWLYLGKRPYPNDSFTPTEKEIAIGHFKEGFATNIFPTIHVSI